MQITIFQIYFYKQVSPVSAEEFRILGLALEKAGQPVFPKQVLEELSAGSAILHGTP